MDVKSRNKMKGQKMRGAKTLRHEASGGFFKGERLASRLACGEEEGVCVCVCVCVCVNLCAHTRVCWQGMVVRA